MSASHTLIGANACDCGYPTITGAFAHETAELNVTVCIGPDGSSIVLPAIAPGAGWKPTMSSYGRASWPMTIFFDKQTQLPVIP
jgi:hypothetical protein